MGGVKVTRAPDDPFEDSTQLADGRLAEGPAQLAFERIVKAPRGGERGPTARSETQALHPAVLRIRLSLDVTPLDHLGDDLRHPLVGDLQAPRQLALAGLLLGQGPEHLPIGPAEIVEPAPRQVGAQEIDEALVGEPEQNPEIDRLSFLFNPG